MFVEDFKRKEDELIADCVDLLESVKTNHFPKGVV